MRETSRSRCGRGPLLVLVLVFALGCVTGAEARIGSVSQTLAVSAAASYEQFTVFGFKKGGTAEFKVAYESLTNPSGSSSKPQHETWIVGCSGSAELEIERISAAKDCFAQTQNSNSWMRNTCENFQVGNVSTDPKNTVDTIITLTQRKRLHWGILMCGDGSATVDVDYIMKNGNEYLGTDYDVLPNFYLAMTVIWSVLHWAHGTYNMLYHYSKISKLHQMFMSVPVVKILFMVACFVKWDYMSRRGYESDDLYAAHAVLNTLNQAATFGALLVISRGWCLTRHLLRRGDLLTVGVATGVLAALHAGYRYFAVPNLAFFALVLCYMTCVAMTLAGTTRNMRELKAQLLMMRQADMNPAQSLQQMKYIIYNRFQLNMFTFVSVSILMEIILLFLPQYPYLSNVFIELVDLIFCASVAYAFRLRDPNPFNTHEPEFDVLPINPATLDAGNPRHQNLIQRMGEMGMPVTIPLARIYETEVFAAKKPGDAEAGGDVDIKRHDNDGTEEILLQGKKVVVVENPPKLGKGGDVTENISLGSRDACGEIETSAVALEVADIEEEVVEEASEDAPEMASGGDIEMGEATSERAE
jgi:hypothetical protein